MYKTFLWPCLFYADIFEVVVDVDLPLFMSVSWCEEKLDFNLSTALCLILFDFIVDKF